MESRFEIHVSEDALEAHVDVTPGAASNRDSLVAALSEAGVRKGLIDEALDSLAARLADPSFCSRDIVVARGVAPRPGERGWSVTGESLPCAEVDDPELLEVSPLASEKRLVIAIGEDSMLATARVLPGEPGDRESLGRALARAGVVHGLTPEAEALVTAKLPDPLFGMEALVVARGTPPIRGADGFFTPEFPEEAPAGQVGAGRVHADGHIDYWERSNLVPVEPGAALGVYTRATQGTPGRNVRGQELPAASGDERMPGLGEGVEKESETGPVRAVRAGVISYQEARRLDVVDASEHRGDVDLKSGNLRVSGSILITGSVTPNARVSATGDVVIKGLVDGGGVASDGQVVVAGGVIGQDEAWIRALGDVTCRHAQGARIECRETLVIQKMSFNSRLHARVVQGESGSLDVLGGVIEAAEKIVIREAGSPLGARTVLAVARPLPACEDEATREDEATLAQAREEEHRLLGLARIEVLGTVHPGVVVQFGRFSTTIDAALRSVSFRYDERSSPAIVVDALAP